MKTKINSSPPLKEGIEGRLDNKKDNKEQIEKNTNSAIPNSSLDSQTKDDQIQKQNNEIQQNSKKRNILIIILIITIILSIIVFIFKKLIK